MALLTDTFMPNSKYLLYVTDLPFPSMKSCMKHFFYFKIETNALLLEQDVS